MTTVFRCDLQPIAKQRPKVGQGRGYTPERTARFEKEVREAYEAQALPKHEGLVAFNLHLRKNGFTLFIDPIAEMYARTLKGDLDNYTKSIADALNKVAYADDKQIGNLMVNDLLVAS